MSKLKDQMTSEIAGIILQHVRNRNEIKACPSFSCQEYRDYFNNL